MQLTRFFSVALLVAAIAADTRAASMENRPVTMDECVQMALEHNLDVQIARLGPLTAQYTLSSSYSAFEPALESSYVHSFGASPGGIDPQGRLYAARETESDSLRIGLTGQLPTGFGYSISTSLSDTYGSGPGFAPDFAHPVYNIVTLTNLNDGYTFRYATVSYNTIAVRDPFENSASFAGLSMSQPLLKNFWIDGARLVIALNKKTLKESEFALRGRIMQTVTDVQVAYLNLISAREQLKVQEKALQLAEALLRENKKRVEVGVLAPLDEKQAESAVAANRASLLGVQNTLASRQNFLKSLLTDKYSDLQDVVFEPSEKLAAAVQVFNRQDSWQKGMSMRTELLQSRLELEKQGITLRYRRNQLYPELNLTGGYGMSGAGKEFSDALGSFRSGAGPSYSIGATLRLPLSKRAERYSYKQAKVDLDQALLRLKQLEQGILVQIDDAIGTAQSSLDQVEATRQARLYAEAALEAEQKKLENGKSTSFLVLDAQERLTRARSGEIAALTAYNIALAQLALSEGSTLERNRLRVEAK